MRFRFWLAIALAFVAILGPIVRGQISDEEKRKREEFLKTRASPSATPNKSPAAKRKIIRRTTQKSPAPKPGKKRKRKTVAPEEKPATRKAEPEKPTPSRVEAVAPPVPRAIPVTTPTARELAEEKAQVVIEKSGVEADQGFVPPPTPEPRRFLFWRSSSGPSYRYLTRSVIEQIRRAPVQRRRWQFIVVHNSGTRQGNAAVFDYYHRRVRRMQNGLAYHFVIGNGTSTRDGQAEVGERWRRQINGGHVHSDYLNNIALGICLVGDFNRDQPTRAQLECCEELIRYLRQRCGKIDNREILVRPHRQMNPPRWATDCPGDVFPYSWFRRFQ